MTPILAAEAVITAVCAIARAVNTAQRIYAKLKRSPPEEAAGSKSDVPVGAFDLILQMNHLVSRFGGEFGGKLDDEVKNQVSQLEPKIRAAIRDLDKFKSDIDLVPETIEAEKQGKVLWGEINGLKDKITEALSRFTERNGPTNVDEQPISPTGRPLAFCRGAVLCQSGKMMARDLKIQGSEKTWGFVCGYCFLEVADYHALRLSRNGEPVFYSDMMAASHAMACASFTNRRAFYKCLVCYGGHRDADFSSASALEKHMEKHPDYNFIENEPEVVNKTEEKIRHWIAEPTEPQCLAAGHSNSDPEVVSDSLEEAIELAVRELVDNRPTHVCRDSPFESALTNSIGDSVVSRSPQPQAPAPLPKARIARDSTELSAASHIVSTFLDTAKHLAGGRNEIRSSRGLYSSHPLSSKR